MDHVLVMAKELPLLMMMIGEQELLGPGGEYTRVVCHMMIGEQELVQGAILCDTYSCEALREHKV